MDRALGGVPWWPMTKQEDEEKSFIKTCHYKQHVAFGASSSPMSSSKKNKNDDSIISFLRAFYDYLFLFLSTHSV